MLPKAHRLNIRLRQDEFFKKAQRLHSELFSLYHLPNDHMEVGVIVSKKISKKAVVRNKLRRQILAAIAKNISLDTPLALIIQPKPPVLKLTFDQLSTNLIEKVHTCLHRS